MVNKKEFERGWRYAGMLDVAQASDFAGYQYVMKVADAIEDLELSINSYAGSAKGNPQLGGEIAEEWAAGTFNIRATAAESRHRAYVEKSLDHASIDVSTNFGENYSLKYLDKADRSVKAQAKNVIQNYHEYLSRAKSNRTRTPMSFEEYLTKYGYTDDLEDLLMSVYRGQGRIIPSDQLEDGIKKLQQLIATESARGGEARLANMRNYQETLEALRDRISDGEGMESIPLSKEEAHAIAGLCKTGNFHPEDFGITLDSEITRNYILNQALKSGINAAVITLAIQLVPEILDLISCLVKEKKIHPTDLMKFGISTLSAVSKGFIIGGLSCGIFTACRCGKLGAEFTKIQPGLVGTIAALSYNMLMETVEYIRGKSNIRVYNHKITRDLIISCASVAGGTLATAVLPVANAIAFVTGSMIGSVVGSFIFSLSDRALVSFCVNTGFTLFGLVSQDYQLPEDILKGMGVSLTEIKQIRVNKVKLSEVSLNTATLSLAKLNRVDIQILKRGIVSFHSVGYLL